MPQTIINNSEHKLFFSTTHLRQNIREIIYFLTNSIDS